MPTRRVAAFAGRVLLAYLLLMAPWPGLREVYSTVFRTGCQIYTGTVGDAGRVELMERADDSRDTWFQLTRRGSRAYARNGVDSRYAGYLPTVLVTALILCTSLPWNRRLRALAWGLALVHLFIAVRLAFSIYADFVLVEGVALADIGTGGRALVRIVTELLSEIVTSAVAAVVIWIVSTFRSGDWETLFGAELPARQDTPG